MSKVLHTNLDLENLDEYAYVSSERIRPVNKPRTTGTVRNQTYHIHINVGKDGLKKILQLKESSSQDTIFKDLKITDGGVLHEVKFKDELKGDMNRLKILFDNYNIKATFSVKTK